MSAITKTSFSFIKDLKDHNSKEWFNENRKRYELAKAEMVEFADSVLEVLRDGDVIETPSGKKSLMRIFRDVRFSKDKSPYKNHWGGGFKRAEDRRGGFYWHIEPGKSFIGGGFWGPSPADLLLIRKQISADADPLKAVLNSKEFKAYFGEMQGDAVKTSPKGFDKTDPEIELLRYKQYLVSHEFTDKEVQSKDFAEKVGQGFLKMLPFFDVMTEYLTTDLNGISLLDQEGPKDMF